jgi:transcription termination factor NusB
MNKFGISRIESYAREFENSCGEDLFKIAIIKKLPNGEWTVMSEKGKPLGKYKTKEKAVKRLRQIEFFKKHKKAEKKDPSYSSIMRELRKSSDEETVKKFQNEFKKLFDQAIINGSENPEKEVLEEALKIVAEEKDKYTLNKIASAIDLGNPEYAGKYLADVLKFVMRRISPERRPKSLENLRKKVYYLNEYEMAGKKVPPSSAIGQSITLLKHILLEHDPKYIRNVLNSVVKHI